MVGKGLNSYYIYSLESCSSCGLHKAAYMDRSAHLYIACTLYSGIIISFQHVYEVNRVLFFRFNYSVRIIRRYRCVVFTAVGHWYNYAVKDYGLLQ